MSLMSQHEWVLFFLQIGLMLSMALAGGYVMRKLHQPAVLGELLGGIILIASVGKIAGAGFGAWLGGLSPREALAVGSGLNARGAIEIILASVALEYRIIDQRIFIALVIMALVTSMFSGPLMQRLIQKRET